MRLIIASESTEERHRFRQAAVAVGLDCDAADCVNIAGLGSRLARSRADAAIGSVGVDVAASLQALHRITAAGIPTYAVCDSFHESLVPILIRSGALGYLRRAKFGSDLVESLADLRHGLVRTAYGRTIAVVGAHSGVGTTTIATNLAFALAERSNGRVALAQFANGRPDLATNLGLAPETSFRELASGWPWLQPAAIERLLIRYPRGPAILADQRRSAAPVQWTPVALRHVLNGMRARFTVSVADFGQPLDAARLAALRLADTIAIVLQLDAPTVTATQELISALVEAGVSLAKVTAIVNRHGQPGELSWPRVRSLLGLNIGEWIPADPESANRAVNVRQPLVITHRAVPIAASFARLAAKFSPRQLAAG